MQNKSKKTVVVNLFAGPGAGKSTCAWEIASKLKKLGYVCEYVSEYAKDLVWDGKLEMLDGTLAHQKEILAVQNHRQERLIGKVDFVITDSPTILNIQYLKEDAPEYIKKCIEDYKSNNNFSIFIQRGKDYEIEGRIHTKEQSEKLDVKIKEMLKENDIYFGTYNYETIDLSIDNMIQTYKRINRLDNETLKTASKDSKNNNKIRSMNMQKNFYNIEELVSIPIQEILHIYGIEDIKPSGDKFVTSIRNEKDPSFYIYPKTNTFYDFGLSEGGNGLNLVSLLSGCTNKEAFDMLAKMFNIQPINRNGETNSHELTNSQYEKIGIYGDLATKNFDIDVEKYGEKSTKAFTEKYAMSMNELSKQYPTNYNQTIKLRAIPYVYGLRNEYYQQCLLADIFCKECNIDILTRPEQQKALEIYRDISIEADKILQRAIHDPELKKSFKIHNYDIATDIQNIRNGTIQVEMGTIPYAELKTKADKTDEKLCYQKYSLDEFFKLEQGELKSAEYSAFVKADTVNIAYRPSEPIQLSKGR